MADTQQTHRLGAPTPDLGLGGSWETTHQQVPLLAVWLTAQDAKVALLADNPDVYFTTAHFDGYRIILIRLAQVPLDELMELIVEAWLDRAPKRLTRQYMKGHE